jgi:type II secretory pathway pseudopilin PulG
LIELLVAIIIVRILIAIARPSEQIISHFSN